MNDPIEFIKQNIGRHPVFALGTVDPEGHPWVVCLGLSYDEKLNIIWVSHKETLHSKYIQSNPNVSICVFSKTPETGEFGFYAKATAREVTESEELKKLLEVRATLKEEAAPPSEKFSGESGMRLYCAELSEAWMNDDRHHKQHVDLSLLS